jgi:ACS family hexuronate transporter-like MFS transporter
LLFIATTMNYLDRSVLGVISKPLSNIMHWDNAKFANINAAWTAGYAIGFLIMGRLVDRLGTKLGYGLSLTLWSLAAAATGFTRGTLSFGAARLSLGIFEAGNFPAAARTTAEWFPQRQRALATGIFNAGSNIGNIIAPLCVPILMLNWGWQSAFVVTGIFGFAWVLIWLPLYSSPSASRFTNPAERDLILSGSVAETILKPLPWRKLFPYGQTWCIVTGKFMTDAMWYFLQFWAGKFLYDHFKADVKNIGLPLITIAVMADIGSIGGGWISSAFLEHGKTANFARKTAMLICAGCVLPVSMVTQVSSMWVAVLLLGLASAAHQGFSANMLTLASDMFPRRAIASVSGLGGCAGAIGGMIMQYGSGHVIQATGSYFLPFIVVSLTYLLTIAIMHVLAPNLAPIPTDRWREA